MSSGFKRGAAAAGTVVIAAAVNVATGMLTQHWAVAWWAATVMLVAVGAGTQAWLTLADRGSSGDAAGGLVTITGNVSGIVSTGVGSTNTQSR
jgi:hypothetical protein